MKEFQCLRCQGMMKFYARERIQLGETGWILGDLPNLWAGSLDVEIYVCSRCRKLEFYAGEIASEEELPQITCPVCGTRHDFDYPKCPKCKHEYY